MRYYGALMTSKLLPEGTVNYNELNDLCMIVIAGFDIGGEGNASLQLVALVCCPFRLQIAFALWTKRHALKCCASDRGLTIGSYFAGLSLPTCTSV